MSFLCIYHGNCQDGFASACVVRYFLAAAEVEFHLGVYQTDPPDVTDKDVIIVDFSYKKDVILKMSETANSILILDHHKTAQDDLLEFVVAPSWDAWSSFIKDSVKVSNFLKIATRFDMSRSGAGLTWDYFSNFSARPKLIDYIEDRDLWKFNLNGTKEISAALFSYPYDFEVWENFLNLSGIHDNYGVNALSLEGKSILRKHYQDIENLLSIVKRYMIIGGISMPVANLPIIFTSDAGHKMASEADGVAACYWDTPDGRVFSLRSTDAGPDVSLIAKDYGGGGHPHAAGFKVKLGWEGDDSI